MGLGIYISGERSEVRTGHTSSKCVETIRSFEGTTISGTVCEDAVQH